MIQTIGLLAGLCTTIAFVPQVVKCWRSRSTSDISLGMFLIMTLGVGLWLAYGFLSHDLPLILANGVTFVLVLLVLLMKVRFG